MGYLTKAIIPLLVFEHSITRSGE